ncbi:transposase family protein [Flexistipes sinusarabici]
MWYKYVRTWYKGGSVIIKIAPDRFSLKCPNCKSRSIILKGKKLRRLRAIPIGSKPVFIETDVQHIFCSSCQVTRQVKLGFSKYRRTYTRAF